YVALGNTGTGTLKLTLGGGKTSNTGMLNVSLTSTTTAYASGRNPEGGFIVADNVAVLGTTGAPTWIATGTPSVIEPVPVAYPGYATGRPSTSCSIKSAWTRTSTVPPSAHLTSTT